MLRDEIEYTGTYFGLKITFKEPKVIEIPWVYIKDHRLRYPDAVYVVSVIAENIGHIGFLAKTANGYESEINYGPYYYRQPIQLRKEDSLRAMVDFYLEISSRTDN